MSEQVQSAAPVAAESAAQSENTENMQDSAELSAEEQEAEADLDSSEEEVPAKDAKSDKKDDKAKKKAEKEVEKRLKKLKLKVDGKEIEEELDLDDEERLVKELQMAKMGQKRAQEKAQLEKEVNAFLQALKNDPMAILAQQLGLDPAEVIDKYINNEMEKAKKSPEQLEKERMEAELKALKEEREREKEELKQKELTRLQEQAYIQYDTQMEQTLAKSDLPKTPYVVKKMADYMIVALDAGKNVSPDDVVDIVREELHSDLQQMFSSLPEEKIEELLGEQVLNKLRKRRVAKAQAAQKAIPQNTIKDTGKVAKAEGKAVEKQSFKDFFKI